MTKKKSLSIFNEKAKYYDLIYSFKDYEKEAEKIKKLISKYKKSSGKELLDVACGTGRHLDYLKKDFSCWGVDINEGMLDIARERVKGATFKKADMVNLDLGKKFDVVTCLFSSIGYVKTYSNLRKAIKNFANHLKSGGVVIIEPWFRKETYNTGTAHMATFDGKNIKIARLNISERRGSISVLDMHYLVAEKDKEVKHFTEKHELGLFEIDKTLEIMEKAVLKAKFFTEDLMVGKGPSVKQGRGFYVGVKE